MELRKQHTLFHYHEINHMHEKKKKLYLLADTFQV
jgi:hypothetical protein